MARHHPRRRRGHTGPKVWRVNTQRLTRFVASALPASRRDRSVVVSAVNNGIILGLGLAGAALGFDWAGVLGAFLGLGAGVGRNGDPPSIGPRTAGTGRTTSTELLVP
jgi:hypothetical protein